MRRFTVALVATAVVSTGLLAAGPPATAAPLLPFPVGTVLIGRDASDAVILLAPDGTGSTYGQDGALQLAVDGFGDGFAVDRSNSVIEHLADGTIRVPIGLAHPVGEIAVSPAGDLFVPDRGHGTVIKAPADGGPATTLGVGLVGAEGVAVDPVGNVYVTGGSPVGTVTEIPADGGPQRPVVSNLSQPMGIVAAPNGDLYVADLGAAQVLRFPGGGGPGVPVGSGWVRPSQLALDAFGNVYVRDSGRPGITVVAAGTGSQRTVGAGIPLPTSVAVFAPPPTFGPGLTVPTGVVGKAYTTGTPTVTVPPNEPAPTYSVVNGVLPQGLSLDPVTGRISGTPQVPGTYMFRLQVANAATGTVSGPLSITVASPGFVAAYGPDRFGETRVPGSAGVNPSGVTSIAAAYGVSFAVANGRVVGWGDNGVGQLNIPAGAGSNVTKVAATSGGGLALKDDNTLVEWGFQAPALPAGLSGALAPHIDAITGENVFYLALAGGKVTEWGAPDNFGISNVPAAAKSGVVAVDSGTGHGLALSQDGGVVGWGYNNAGQATVPDAARSFVQAIAAGGNHSLALKNDHTLVAWGDLNAVPAAAQGRTIAIAAGQSFDAALLYDGTIITWGATGTNQTIAPPTDGTVTTALAAGDRHLLALRR